MLTPAVARTAAKPGRFAEGSEVGLGRFWSAQPLIPQCGLFLLVPGRVGRRGRGGGIGDCGDVHAGGGEDNSKAAGGGEQ